MNLRIKQTITCAPHGSLHEWVSDGDLSIPWKHILDSIQNLSWFPHTILTVLLRDPIRSVTPIDETNAEKCISLEEALSNTLSEDIGRSNFAIRGSSDILHEDCIDTLEMVEGKLVLHKLCYVLVRNEEDAFLLSVKYR